MDRRQGEAAAGGGGETRSVEVTFLASTLGPRVAAACAHVSLGSLSKESSTEGSPGGYLSQHDAEGATLSAEKVISAAEDDLTAAAMKAKLFADHEEREIQALWLCTYAYVESFRCSTELILIAMSLRSAASLNGDAAITLPFRFGLAKFRRRVRPLATAQPHLLSLRPVSPEGSEGIRRFLVCSMSHRCCKSTTRVISISRRRAPLPLQPAPFLTPFSALTATAISLSAAPSPPQISPLPNTFPA
ncbi:SWI/SNF complex subunit SWI3C-like [Salvia divinorum]|uniref:SWI/SNF complex subunit SWI3C-like n=1 Tax=Salvia divinorum TaxID=28513 RepID=A0ABD1FTU2_SALDI